MAPGALSTSFDCHALETVLFDDLGLSRTSRFVVAFSGGLDSTALLTAMAAIAGRTAVTVTAAHVNHGLHRDADAWQHHCQNMAERLGVEFRSGRVHVVNAGSGLEAGARHERYGWLTENVDSDSILLTAHHGHDQAETMLQRALRSGGSHALGAMRLTGTMSGLELVRPLLGFTRDALRDYLKDAQNKGHPALLNDDQIWIEDPANADPQFDRSFIRTDVMPLLSQRWPNVHDAFARVAAQAAEDADLLQDLARIDLDSMLRHDIPSAVQGDLGLCLAALQELSDARQRNVLRYWIRQATGHAPARVRLQSLLDDLCGEAEGTGSISLGDFSIHKYKAHLYFEKSVDPEQPTTTPPVWDFASPLVFENAGLRLVADAVKGQGVSQASVSHVTVRARESSDRLRIHANAPSRSLKNLFQEYGIPPWQRRHLPVLGRPVDDRLIAVPGLGVDASVQARPDETGWVIRVQRLSS